MRVARPLLMLLRALIAVQILLGAAFWAGYLPGLVNLHVALGSAFVFVLWMIAAIAIAKKRSVPLALVAILWGALIGAFGIVQRQMLVGDMHWVIRVLHLVVGIVAMPM